MRDDGATPEDDGTPATGCNDEWSRSCAMNGYNEQQKESCVMTVTA